MLLLMHFGAIMGSSLHLLCTKAGLCNNVNVCLHSPLLVDLDSNAPPVSLSLCTTVIEYQLTPSRLPLCPLLARGVSTEEADGGAGHVLCFRRRFECWCGSDSVSNIEAPRKGHRLHPRPRTATASLQKYHKGS